MPASEFQYAILRLVPCIERGERINVGVVLFCRQRNFLAARVDLDRRRLSALTSDLDPEEVSAHLRALVEVAQGKHESGMLASLPASERFGWLVATASTVIQPSPVHTGMTDDPPQTLERLFRALVARTTSEH